MASRRLRSCVRAFRPRFDDLSTEVALLEERLASGTGDARKIKATASALAESLPTANVLGDVDALAARLTAIREHAESIAAADRARREEHRAAQTARKEALAAEAEELAANSTQWKAAGDRLRAILEEWKTITGVDRKTDDALWKRYAAAREMFNRRRDRISPSWTGNAPGPRHQGAAVSARRRTRRIDGLEHHQRGVPQIAGRMEAAGRAAREVDDALWRRFKAAQDKFFQARNAATAERDAELRANAAAKEALLAEAEKLDTSNHDAARAALRSIAERWDKIGKVPRERSAELERRLRAVKSGCATRLSRLGPTRRRSPGRAVPRRAEQFERQAEKAQAAGRSQEADEARPTPSSGASGPRPPPTR
ncbi:hypothetical protein I553_1702 [Mycobacterium xenopi 4042]|uniref:DUF349 domain-containing protein n=1 Tax=Mycobacterium xenopi 4042 TaxID=1299334 RepID=X7ZBG4_MYCXE|nr:hypothetical protein I553_1702 [Mycobacterium xenopi 4042]